MIGTFYPFPELFHILTQLFLQEKCFKSKRGEVAFKKKKKKVFT